ncbi:SLIT2 [Branchiostoma lanceolatum]|uniref:SLIT2 protein n=1 Tax=Branchiostoma lanceolatum TaxID=7740 RepID=A0A8J9Z1J7_BRALA|nr:SLIT2 [Branchiostoma lanceolatum]CAH1245848.1 SLIT2 [Branchiostoma lanceolatum]CAH1245849.1 SLIT2 [Branchiostoma lanceolatum]
MLLTPLLLCLLACVLTLPAARAEECPPPCTCYLQTYPVRANAMDCINIGPAPVPATLANGTEILKLYHNNISHVPADWFGGRGYVRLQMLYLSYNSIRTVAPAAFRPLRLLQALYIDYNDISELPEGVFTDLHSPVLSLSHNRLETLGPGVFASHMQQLDISYNNIGEILAGAFQGLWSLEVLKLDNNRLERIEAQAFAGLGNMRYLHLAHNQLTTLAPQTFAGLEKVMFIWLHDNVLDRLQDGTFDDIGSNVVDTIDLSNNHIASVGPATFRGLRVVNDLKLSDNMLTAVPSAALSGLRLTHLYLDYNPISRIEAGAFRGLQGLQILYLANMPELANIEDSAFANLHHLRYIIYHVYLFVCLFVYLANMPELANIEDSAFANLHHLRYIIYHVYLFVCLFVYLANMPELANIEDSAFANLHHLGYIIYHVYLFVCLFVYLANMPELANIEDSAFANLHHLRYIIYHVYLFVCLFVYLANMPELANIEDSAFANLHHLGYIIYHLANIEDSAFANLHHLRYIIYHVYLFVCLFVYLANMPELANIEDSAFANLHHLRELYLFGNFLLSAIHRDAFLGLWSLHKLSMWHTALSGLEPDVFRHLRNLKELLLNGNVLSTLDASIFRCLDSLEEVYLYDNPLRCDCRLRWLREWMETTDVNFEPDSQWLSCFFGASYRRVTSIALDEFHCNDTEYDSQPTCEPAPTFEPLVPSTPEAEQPFVAPPTVAVRSQRLNVTTNSITVGWSGVPDGQYAIRYNVIGSADVQVSGLKRDPVFTLDGLSAGRVYNICLVLMGPDRGNRALQCTTVSTAKESSSTGVIIGAVLGLLIALLLLVCILVFCCCIRRKKQQANANGNSEVPVHFSAANGEIKHENSTVAAKGEKRKGRSRPSPNHETEEPSYSEMAEDNPLIINGKDDGKMGAVSEMFTNTHAEV